MQQSAVKDPTAQQPTAEQLTYLAQAVVNDCRPGDSSMVCCIKKFPLTPVESCGATAADVAGVLNGVRVLHEAAQSSDGAAAPVAGGKEEEDDFANNAHLPEWKQRCIRAYTDCINDGWTGNCHDCLRYCEGQQEWPSRTCAPPKRR